MINLIERIAEMYRVLPPLGKSTLLLESSERTSWLLEQGLIESPYSKKIILNGIPVHVVDPKEHDGVFMRVGNTQLDDGTYALRKPYTLTPKAQLIQFIGQRMGYEKTSEEDIFWA